MGGRENGENTYYVSVGRDLPPKGVQDGGIFHCTNSEKGLKFTCLKTLKGSLLVWRGVVKFLLPRIGVP